MLIGKPGSHSQSETDADPSDSVREFSGQSVHALWLLAFRVLVFLKGQPENSKPKEHRWDLV